jgi:hypothetical protein
LFQSLDADALMACAASATRCSDWLECTNAPYGPSYCATHPGASCDSTYAVACSSAVAGGRSTACASGYPCAIEGGVATWTNGVACIEPDPYAAMCLDDAVTWCSDSDEMVGFQCGAKETCEAVGTLPGPIMGACLPDGTSTAPCIEGSPSCDGPVSSICSEDVVTRFDCAAVGMQCLDGAPGDLTYLATCVLLSSACSDAVDDPTCWCVAGQ